MHLNRDATLMSGNFSRLRTSELRQLLNDDQKMSCIIRLSKKFQGLQWTKEDIMASNCRLAEINLSHKPTLRKGKVKLANKHQELEKLIISVQAKQDQLSALLEGHILKATHMQLLKKIEENEEDSEVLFQKFVEGRMSVEKFLGRFQNSRWLHHIQLVQAGKILDILELKPKGHLISTETHNSKSFPLDYPPNLPNTCPVHYSLVPFVILPNFYHPYSSVPFLPPSLPPLSGYGNSAQLLQPRVLDFHQTSQHLRFRVHEQTPRWPARPARLEQLNLPTRHRRQEPR